jgi:chorismate mutase
MLAQINGAAVNELEAEEGQDALWRQIQRHLQDEKVRLFQEIRSYPPPITACDAQFNGLLEERATVLRILGEVKSIAKQGRSRSEQIEWLGTLLSSSPRLNDKLAEQIRHTIAQLAP